ncbi:MAG: glycoside hydrolase family 15 protein [Anaerolineales bacterium]|nr:glycoside hydrolase family 15 protein [Anaerolineales bacterium]
MGYRPIGDYGVIGDLNTVALISREGSIDFMCFPDFDSPTIFARILDDQQGGYFSICPQLDDAKLKQLYIADTNVLLTRFLLPDGVAELSDYMPIEQEQVIPNLVRRIKAVRGTIKVNMRCHPAFDYARAEHDWEINDGEVLFTSRGPDGLKLRLRSEVPVEVLEGAAVAEFTLKEGESAAFILEQVLSGTPSPCAVPNYVADTFKDTVNYWHTWIESSNYRGRWREMVNRSALTLKLITSQVHGSMVAAPTFGLPEVIGGERNWDYRYTWIRDSAFIIYSLLKLGFSEEAKDFTRWIKQRTGYLNEDGSLQVIYGLDGSRDLEEEILPHLDGYRGSKPVRIGNGAHDQLQLDIYGELMDALYLMEKYHSEISHDLWMNLVKIISYVTKNWEQPDEGIWEIRGGKHHFLYSRLMCWVAIDRGIRIAQKRSFPAPLEHWRQVRNEIYNDIYQNFWDSEKGAFTQVKRGKSLDASSLLMPIVQFISPTDPRWLSHLENVENELVYDSLVYRYSEEAEARDGLSGIEGTFSICTFWYVENLSRSGQIRKARLYLEKMLGYANHLGLYAEELSPQGEHLGNYPQAFTHLALITAAFDLNQRLGSEDG